MQALAAIIPHLSFGPLFLLSTGSIFYYRSKADHGPMLVSIMVALMSLGLWIGLTLNKPL